jgi:serine phosphatase RsbU (regulator of sigma subunit)
MRRHRKHDSGESGVRRGIWLGVCAIPAVAVLSALGLSRVWPGIPVFWPVLAVPPALAGVGASRARRPLICGILMLALAAAIVPASRSPFVLGSAASGFTGTMSLAIATVMAIALVTAASAIGVAQSGHAETSRRLADVTTVAEATQRALLRPMPDRVGPLELDVLYLAAAAGARVGGDLYEVADTRHGIRLIVGDVRGKGLDAVEIAADVLGMFREVAHEVYTLAEMARRIDAGLARRPGSHEDFVTAVFAEIDPSSGEMTIYNCGHPPPIVLSARRQGTGAHGAAVLEVPSPAPPLRLMTMGDWSGASRTLTFRPGEMLLLYTDGVTEARDPQGRLYPLAERIGRIPGRRRLGRRSALLERLHEDLLRHAAAPLDDDAAMVLIQAPASWQDRQALAVAVGERVR